MNCYKNARRTAGATQERWAEMLGCSVESIRHWEAGDWLPSDDTVQSMAEISGYSIIGLQHIRLKSRLCNEALPSVERMPLSEAVIRLLLAMKKSSPQVDDMLYIAQDNKVSADEAEVFEEIVGDLNELIGAALAVKYAERGN